MDNIIKSGNTQFNAEAYKDYTKGQFFEENKRQPIDLEDIWAKIQGCIGKAVVETFADGSSVITKELNTSENGPIPITDRRIKGRRKADTEQDNEGAGE